MPNPKVSFIVPCYKLAHFLEESVNSILSQSYGNIEVLILDDQSPDNTEEVSTGLVKKHPDRQITYIRNSENLGNIRNYNKGIRLAAGEHVWILSPDDRLHSKDIVSEYVRLMDDNRDIGFIFCPGNVIENDTNTGVYKRSVYRDSDQILDGLQLVGDIAENNFELLSPSVMIRKKCYEEITYFPEDIPHRGDSYVWALIAMQYRVGYFSTPMVDYRIHSGSMMSTLARENIIEIIADDFAVPWRIRTAAQERGLHQIVEQCNTAIVNIYTRALRGIRCRNNTFKLAIPEFEASLASYEPDPASRTRIRCRVFHSFADHLYWQGETIEAMDLYRKTARACKTAGVKTRLNVLAKLVLIKIGKTGILLRSFLGRIGLLKKIIG